MSSLMTFVALIPIIWLLFSLGYIKMPAAKAVPIGLAISLVLAIFTWNIPAAQAGKMALEGAVLGMFPIIWVILAAIFTYNVSLKTGAMDRIKNLMGSISGDRRIQALIIAWCFGGFMEGAAGFGTAVAIPAAILISLGFEPFFAALICLLANTVAVAFGSVGIPVTTLAKVASLDVMPLTLNVVWQLTPFVVVVPFLLIFTVTKSISGFKGVFIPTLVSGVSFALVQLLVAMFIGPELTAILGSIVALIATTACAKLFPPAEDWRFPHERGQTQKLAAATAKTADIGTLGQQISAWMPYIMLLVLIIGTSRLNPAINAPLSAIKSTFAIYDPLHPMSIEWLTTPGTMILLAAIIGGLVQGASLSTLVTTFGQTIVQLQKTVITVLSIVAMAKVLSYSGMVGSIATALAVTTGKLFPVISPLIGALGTFLTGSDTSSNVLFGSLQTQTATQIGSNPSWLAASNTSGACAGKLISPQSIAIAATATGLVGKEGEIMSTTMKYCLVYVVILGAIVYIFA